MVQVKDIINFLETLAPLHLQEDYDNCGLVCGNSTAAALGAIVALDLTEEVVDEAIDHHHAADAVQRAEGGLGVGECVEHAELGGLGRLGDIDLAADLAE